MCFPTPLVWNAPDLKQGGRQKLEVAQQPSREVGQVFVSWSPTVHYYENSGVCKYHLQDVMDSIENQ